MVRKTSLALVIATVLSPISAHALGLGDIHLKSALNQRLRADIDLLSVKSGDLDTVKIELAGQDAFQRVGADRSYLVTRLRFKAVRRPDGRAIIEVTTHDAVREPFLDFLIEVNWPQGKLVREYTLLLDPPATLAHRPPPVSAPAAKAPAESVGRAVAKAPGVEFTAAASQTPGQYGPVQRNETLWVIAEKVRPGGASVEQTMIALQRANPDAFIKDNVNNLKRGVILRVPEADSVRALSPAQARAAFVEQTARWEADRAPRPQPPAATTAAAAPQPAPQAASPASKPPASEAELQIVSAPAGGKGGTAPGSAGVESQGSAEKLKNDLLLAHEANDSARQEVSELQSRVKDLEAQLTDARTLVTLKDQQLAQLRATLAAGSTATAAVQTAEPAVPAQPGEGVSPTPVGAPETTAGPAAAAPMEAESAPTQPQPEAPVSTQAQTPAATESAPAAGQEPTGAAPAPATAEAPTPAEPGAAAVQPSAPAETVVAESPTPEAAEPAPASAPSPPAPETEPVASKEGLTQGSSIYWLLGGLVVLAGVGVGVASARRRSAKEARSEESILVDLEDKPGESSQLLATSGESDSQTDETSFLSDFSPSDIDALQDETGEVDPVSEADVYMAYNRYQQAEELLRQAIAKEPQRPDLRFKLLEVLVAGHSIDAFIAEAEKVSAEGLAEDHPGEWAKVVALGRDLAPEHPLFSAPPAGTPEATAEDAAASQGAGQTAADEFTEFNLGDLESELEMASSAMAARAESGSEGEQESAEFGDSVFDFVNEDRPAEQVVSSGDVEIETSSDFIAESQPALGETGAEMDFDLGDLSDLDQGIAESSGQADAEGKTGAVTQELDQSATEMGSSLGAQDVDFNRMESIPGEDSIRLDGLDSAMSELEATEDLALHEGPENLEVTEEPTMGLEGVALDDDEVATKLDLARAYIDMGDDEGARSILDEVLGEGTEDQQSEARGLMQRLA